MANTNNVITVSRQYGSGGRLIGEKLAAALGIPYYDKELIVLAAEKSGYSKEVFEQIDERAGSSLLYSLSINAPLLSGVTGYTELPLNDKLFLIQTEVIRKIAASPCVIVGRCADYILEDQKNVIRFFIDAPFDARMKRAIEEYEVPADKVKDVVNKTDKQRSNYYNFYTGRRWGALGNYDLAVNSSLLGIDGTVEVLKRFVELAPAQSE